MTTGRSVLRPVLQVAVAAAITALALLAYAAYRISSQGDLDEARPADAIVVLGAAQFNGTPGGVFEARLEHAVDLYHEKLATLPRRHRRQAPRRSHDGGRRGPGLGDRARRPAGGDPRRGRGPEHPRVDRGRRRHLPRARLHERRSSSATRPTCSASSGWPRPGHRSFGSPTRTSPTDRDPIRRQKALVHELAGLAAYYVGGGRLIDDLARLVRRPP